MKKYLTMTRLGPEIRVVEIEKETEKSVWRNGRRLAKESQDEKYFDSHEEAKNYLQNYIDEKLRLARDNLDRWEEYAKKVSVMVDAL